MPGFPTHPSPGPEPACLGERRHHGDRAHAHCRYCGATLVRTVAGGYWCPASSLCPPPGVYPPPGRGHGAEPDGSPALRRLTARVARLEDEVEALRRRL